MLFEGIVLISALFFPNWLLMLVYIPTLMVLSSTSAIPPIFSVGGADIQLYDIVLLIIILKVFLPGFLLRQRFPIHRIHSVILIWLATLVSATLIAGYRFGTRIFTGEIVAYARFLTQVMIVFLLLWSAKTDEVLSFSLKTLRVTGYVISSIIYFNLILVPFRISIGEVQVTHGIVRSFGPIGDQIGFILLFFIFWELLQNNYFRALIIGGALLATGTRGVFLAAFVGSIALLIYIYKQHLLSAKLVSKAIAFIAILAIIFFLNVGGMKSRFLNPLLFQSGFVQRETTAATAVQVAKDNLLTGTGYSGFRYIAYNYHAKKLFTERLGGFATNYIATTGNQYLQTLTDGGVLALLVFFMMVWEFLYVLRTTSSEIHGREAFFRAGYIWLLSLLIGNQTATWLLPSSLISYLLWVILGITLAAKNLQRLEGL